MDIQASSSSNVVQSIQKLNDLMKSVAQSEVSFAQKMLRVSVTARVEGLGENIDVSA